jgi:hypothetical protein
MKRVMSVGLLMLVALVALIVVDSQSVAQRATATRTPTATPYPKMYVTAAANGRSCPKLTCEVVETFSAGEEVEIVGTKSGDSVKSSKVWYEVKQGRGSVFVHSSLLTDRKPTARATQRPTSSGVSATAVPGATTVAQPTQPPVSAGCPDLGANCPQLTCAQAYACLAAGNGSLDRDKDGKPCETQCGG